MPEDVTHIIIHPSIKVIEDEAFEERMLFRIVILNDGLEEILLQDIIIPNNVKAIKERAFRECSGYMTVTLGKGLEEIGY